MLAADLRIRRRCLRLPLRVIALLQVLVMLVLAVPACAGELPSADEHTTITASASATDVDDDCPCCPVDDGADSSNCSSCSFCSSYIPLTSITPAPGYSPIIKQLVAHEKTVFLPEVHLPIFTPPQNA